MKPQKAQRYEHINSILCKCSKCSKRKPKVNNYICDLDNELKIRADEKAKILQEILKFMDNVNKVYHTTPTELKIRRYLEAEIKKGVKK